MTRREREWDGGDIWMKRLLIFLSLMVSHNRQCGKLCSHALPFQHSTFPLAPTATT
jgi:hypothetical protein